MVRLLAIHDSAEEEVVHPVAKRARFGAEEMVDLSVHHPNFQAELADFADAVADHAAHEEAEEFVLLRRQYSATQLQRTAGSVRAAEAVAPTRPHPHTGSSAAANLIAGPPPAVFDRVRDAVRDWRTHG
ncbi:hypothetical protein ACFYTS_14235 [Nocardia sp. NPDC004151]|uniref:hypothetical protein n=1 Tax=Nocardia sp. NPDC004151 TaxID=3364304 RepID=UPI0036908567